MTSFGGHTQIVPAKQGVRKPKISKYIKPEMDFACSKMIYGEVAKSFWVAPKGNTPMDNYM
jgi:hypothetical protein